MQHTTGINSFTCWGVEIVLLMNTTSVVNKLDRRFGN